MKRRELVGIIASLTAAATFFNMAKSKATADESHHTNIDGKNNLLEQHGQKVERQQVCDVRDYGATGNGKTDDAKSIQKAIDECSVKGGGVVLLRSGIFLSGGLVLKDDVELNVASTAILLGSPAMEKFNKDDKFNHGEPVRSFIHADGAHHIAITGSGKIDGQGHLFKSGGSYSVRPWLIQLRGCTNVRIENILLTNSAVWACWLLQCNHLRLDGVRIENPISPNRDGVDIDGCRDVMISNCNFNTEDDSIAFKVSQKGFPCKDIVITNCILSSRCAAIRFGPDAADNIENVTISNCVIRNTKLNGIKIQEALGAAIRNITFSNIVMDNVNGPISIRLAGWMVKPDEPTPFEIKDDNWENGQLENILFSNIRATMPKDNICISITGTSKTRPRNITFSDIDFTFTGGGTFEQGSRRDVPDLDRHYPEMYIFGDLPAYALYIHHASGIVLNNVHLRLQSDDLRPAIVCDDVEDMDISALKVSGSKKAESVMRFQDSKNVFITGSRTLNPVSTFVRVEGSQSKNIVLMGNFLHQTQKKIELAADVDKDAISVLNNF